jgi:hypothetical protein
MSRVDDDLRARAEALDAAAIAWRRLEVTLWILTIVALAGCLLCTIDGRFPVWTALVPALTAGFAMSRASTTRQSRRRAVEQSRRLRGLVRR